MIFLRSWLVLQSYTTAWCLSASQSSSWLFFFSIPNTSPRYLCISLVRRFGIELRKRVDNITQWLGHMARFHRQFETDNWNMKWLGDLNWSSRRWFLIFLFFNSNVHTLIVHTLTAFNSYEYSYDILPHMYFNLVVNFFFINFFHRVNTYLKDSPIYIRKICIRTLNNSILCVTGQNNSTQKVAIFNFLLRV